jgi:PII-like signaling protein
MAGQAESDTKLTIYIGRHQRIAGRPGYQAIVERCRRSGLAAATVLLGVDGTYRGVRHRARFIGRNADVPLMVIALGGSDAVAGVLPALVEDLEEPLLSLERVRVCKREGRLLRPPHDPSHQSSGKLARWQKITVYADESSRHDRRAQHLELIHALRRAGASGATSLRGVWGFHGDQDPHGDSFWQLHRGVPMMTVIIDSPERVAELFGIVDQLTEQAGVVTSELVPAFRATGPGGLQLGGLELAEL